ncbi:hydroxymethylglutaryl-CoA reductase, degradative [Aerococcaceae bacterium INB8]|uniref:3-hydroxy-3-methylglutaryl coenzyme A reductase n=1 Tax=Ruoffia halotolerans TaxID=2748684 RepID=A0A839A687_9LACT|nr:hydroxymethylglutaryl-CoA reductase, degradative [Ruoffia halotolerans]MBA5729411.1 hydroxymethylglutaryl-CoA reductase, degradative [Ruoffia halotolerans]
MDQRQFFSGFYKHSISKRLELMESWLGLSINSAGTMLPEAYANQMIENYLFNYHLPLGVAVNLKVNNAEYVVPMAIEEPSVIAAASFGSKLLGNIQAETKERLLIGQIIMTVQQPMAEIQQIIKENKAKLLDIASQASASMVRRGGGPRDIWVEEKEHPNHNYISIYLSLDPCDAMGANVINTVLEALSPTMESIIEGEVLMSILSNYQPQAVTVASAKVPFVHLSNDKDEAISLAERLELASDYAWLDPYRATTHNKGIMNGIDAVVIATGNDWRAIEAGAHAYAVKEGQYRSLTKWQVNYEDEMLEGSIEIPLQVATVGGTLSSHPTAKLALQMLNITSAKDLSNVIASVGLVQNFAAMRALVSEGIQKGHMRMQARALAMQVGATIKEIPAVVTQLNEARQMNRDTARKILDEIRK